MGEIGRILSFHSKREMPVIIFCTKCFVSIDTELLQVKIHLSET